MRDVALNHGVDETLMARCRKIFDETHGIRLGIVYGSAAVGRLRRDSDVDIAVLGDGPLGLDERLTLTARLASALGREIDLVDLYGLNGLILKQILCKGRVVLNTDQVAYESLARRMIYDSEDFLPLVVRSQKERLGRFVHGR